jgi:hypothetical protein
MTNDFLPCHQTALRGADSNSLLRMYDVARGIASAAGPRQGRARAARAAERIARELRKRNVSCEPPEGASGPPPTLTESRQTWPAES